MRIYKLLLTVLVSLSGFLPFNGMAQEVRHTPPTVVKQLPSYNKDKKKSVANQHTNRASFTQTHPLLARLQAAHAKSLQLKVGQKRQGNIKSKAPILPPSTYTPSAYGVVTFTPDVPYDSLPFISHFNLTSPIKFERNNKIAYYAPIYGSTVQDGQLIGVSFDTSFGQTFNYLVTYDLATGEQLSLVDLGGTYNLVALETGTDPTDGSVFGEFMNANLDGYEYGIADYTARRRTTIAATNKEMVAIGVDNTGQPYGIASDGNLYKIDKTNGEETLIGNTGVIVADYKGEYASQSGEIDPKTNTFYWAAIDSTKSPALYAVDLQTAAATKIADGEFQIQSLFIPAPEADDRAPAAAKDLSAFFDKASLTGTITFTAPDRYYNGNLMLTDLNYTITANGEEVATGKTNSGAVTTANVTLEEGVNNIVVTVSNSTATSPKADLTIYVGYDQPKAPDNVTFAVDKDNNATISWQAPTQGVHDGYIGDLKYDVYRYTDNDSVKVASDLDATTFSETITTGTPSNYKYGVIAKNTTQNSAVGKSNSIVLGTAYEVPFLDEFSNEASFNLFTVIDANDDGSTWTYDEDEAAAKYSYSSYSNGDDWLITPAINLKGGSTYTVAYKTKAQSSTWSEKIEAKWGNGNKVEDLTNTLTPPTDVVLENYVEHTQKVTPEKDGAYNFGFHAISDRDRYYLYLDSVSITKDPDVAAPDSATNFRAIADSNGELKVALSFLVPDKTIGGTLLQSVDSVEVRKGNAVVSTVTNPTPGESLTYTDEKAFHGFNTYSVIAYNESGAGLTAKAVAYAGLDVPATPRVKAQDNLTSVHLTWPEAKGANGGYIDQSDVSYDIFNVSFDGLLADSITTVKGVNEYTLDINTQQGNRQENKPWAVRARNSQGSSQNFGVGYVITGAPYTVPYSNSFTDDELNDLYIAYLNNDVRWNSSGRAYDNDKGALQFRSADFNGNNFTGSASVDLGKFNFAGTSNPRLAFSYEVQKSDDDSLIVEVEHLDGTIEPVWSATFGQIDNPDNNAWVPVSVALPTGLANEPYVKIKFRGVANTDQETYIYIDNLHVTDPAKNDAAVNLQAPASLVKGQKADIEASVTNLGAEDLKDVRLVVTAADKVIADTTFAGTITQFQTIKVPLEYQTTSLQTDNSFLIKAILYNNGDLVSSNDTAIASIDLSQADVKAPTDLQGNENGNIVSLSWSDPNGAASAVTDDFESYTPWAIDKAGDWTFVNNDGYMFGNITDYGYEPNAYETGAFEIWNPIDFTSPGRGYDAHSGQMCLASPYKLDPYTYSNADCDDWIISPDLSGKAQTITFWANNANQTNTGNDFIETFRVLASSTDKNISSFDQIGSEYELNTSSWTPISVDLPEGTRYFAIRRLSRTPDDANLFLVDDITYIPGTGLTGYNIYVDNTLIGNTSDTTFTTAKQISDGKHTFSVTAVYKDGYESEPVTIDLILTGINNIDASVKADSYDVYTLGGSLVKHHAKDLRGLSSGVYIINGKKVLVK